MNTSGQPIAHSVRMIALALALAVLVALWGELPGRADTKPPTPEPLTVSGVPLPTAQIDGVVWSQVVVGNTVYAGGSFSKARPAGAAPGTKQVTRTNLLAFDIRTGVLNASFAPTINGQVLTVTASPDGSLVYIGGQFTSVNGKARNRVAAFATATGALVTSFAPSASSTVRALTATAATVYIGGDFTAVNGSSRPRLAAVKAANGSLLPWNPKANDQVRALTMNPTGSLVIAGGRFTTLNGSPWYGLGALDPTSGASKPWAAESVIRTAGAEASIMSLATGGDSVYGTSYTYGSTGNFEGTFRANGTNGALTWVSDCHGDTYGVFPQGDVVYSASHAHYCANITDGFSESNPRIYYHSTAVTNAADGTNTYNPIYRLTSYAGRPAPRLLHWYPVWSVGSYTGQKQAGWHVTGNAQYVVYGGEFLQVNGTAQQGLVRFSKSASASNTTAPQRTASLTPAAVSAVPGQVSIGWQATFDRDNRSLTYRLYRGSTLINTQTVASTTWRRPTISFTDKAAAGSTQQYSVTVSDPWGRQVAGGATSIKVASATNAYASAVLASKPEQWFRMNDSTGTVLSDSAGSAPATGPATITGGAAGAVTGGGTAMTLSGTSSAYAATEVSQVGPQVFSVEAWFKTSSKQGGRIVGFGDRKADRSKTGFTDRHLYLDGSGRLWFGVYPGSTKQALSSTTGLNNNAWHHAVGTLGPDGMTLYIDGKQVAKKTNVTAARDIQGHWRIGGDTLEGWTNRPPSDNFAGSVDEVAIYGRVLPASEVAAHYSAR